MRQQYLIFLALMLSRCQISASLASNPVCEVDISHLEADFDRYDELDNILKWFYQPPNLDFLKKIKRQIGVLKINIDEEDGIILVGAFQIPFKSIAAIRFLRENHLQKANSIVLNPDLDHILTIFQDDRSYVEIAPNFVAALCRMMDCIVKELRRKKEHELDGYIYDADIQMAVEKIKELKKFIDNCDIYTRTETCGAFDSFEKHFRLRNNQKILHLISITMPSAEEARELLQKAFQEKMAVRGSLSKLEAFEPEGESKECFLLEMETNTPGLLMNFVKQEHPHEGIKLQEVRGVV